MYDAKEKKGRIATSLNVAMVLSAARCRCQAVLTADKIKASFKNGVLTVTMLKSPEAQKRRTQVTKLPALRLHA
jgi:hypothetical protein